MTFFYWLVNLRRLQCKWGLTAISHSRVVASHRLKTYEQCPSTIQSISIILHDIPSVYVPQNVHHHHDRTHQESQVNDLLTITLSYLDIIAVEAAKIQENPTRMRILKRTYSLYIIDMWQCKYFLRKCRPMTASSVLILRRREWV